MHLQEEVYEGHVDDIALRAAAAGVAVLVSCGTHPGDWGRTAEIAETHSAIVPAFGLHPWFIDDAPPDWPDSLRRWLLSVPSLVGETGLDGAVSAPTLDVQEQALRVHMRLARELTRPLCLHCVRAYGRLLEVLRSEEPLPAGLLLHAFAGSPEMIPRFAECGAYFSFGGNVLYDTHVRARRALVAVPEDRLLVETDAPTLLPPEEFRSTAVQGTRGRVWNEPANLPAIAGGIAGLLGVPGGELRRRLWCNVGRFLAPVRHLIIPLAREGGA
jgi:TatD DNase family protein